MILLVEGVVTAFNYFVAHSSMVSHSIYYLCLVMLMTKNKCCSGEQVIGTA